MNPESDRSSSMTSMKVPADEAARIAAELAALGEAEPDELELELMARAQDVDSAWASEDRAFVEMLDHVSAPADTPAAQLDPLAKRRAWKKVDRRWSEKAGTSKSFWGLGLSLGLVLAAAAAMLFVFWTPASNDDAQVQIALRAQAHAGLEAVGVDTRPGADAARVRAILDASKAEGGQG